ncbi:phage baseplate protein [Fusobacterium mortiferum]|uniref:phage baseplate protein n=1 Tax=Fusobacterium mortiferum TaxID=850 RepID=UPI003F933B37
MGDIYLTTNSTNPSSVFLGTTWQKIEGRFLLGTSGSGASKSTGGSNSKANLPAVKIQLDSFSLSRGTMEITGTWKGGCNGYTASYLATGAFTHCLQVERTGNQIVMEIVVII